MRIILPLLLLALPSLVMAQQPANAVIKIRAKTTADFNGSGTPNETVRDAMSEMADDADITLYIKDSLRRLVIKRNRVTLNAFYNDASGSIALVVESPKDKTIYRQTADEQSRESYQPGLAVQLSLRTDAYINLANVNSSETVKHIGYTDIEKAVNNIPCKKALVTLLNRYGDEKTMEVWYTRDYLLDKRKLVTVAGPFDITKLNGLIVKYRDTSSMVVANTDMLLTQQYEIKKIDTGMVIPGEVFRVPEGYSTGSWADYSAAYPYGTPFRKSQKPYRRAPEPKEIRGRVSISNPQGL